MYRVAVCDDVVQDQQEMSAVTAGLLKESGLAFELQRYSSAAELLSAYRHGEVWDLLLLDIMMDRQDGIHLADALRASGNEADLVFITHSPEYALAGYRSYPVSYLLKPLTREKLAPVLSRCLERRQKRPSLTLDAAEGGKITLALGEIRYIEVFRRELVVHCKDRALSCAGPLNAVLEALPPEGFYRCHRSFVVNLAYVSGVQKYQFLLRGDGRVPIATRSYQQAQARWLDYLK